MIFIAKSSPPKIISFIYIYDILNINIVQASIWPYEIRFIFNKIWKLRAVIFSLAHTFGGEILCEVGKWIVFKFSDLFDEVLGIYVP